MRLIEKKMNAAIANGKDWTSGNTSVHHNEEEQVAIVRLYGIKIAEIGQGYIKIWDGGKQSSTTKSRINAIFAGNGIPGESVFQRSYEWFARVAEGNGDFKIVPFTSGMKFS